MTYSKLQKTTDIQIFQYHLCKDGLQNRVNKNLERGCDYNYDRLVIGFNPSPLAKRKAII